jgi:hypothetical protein
MLQFQTLVRITSHVFSPLIWNVFQIVVHLFFGLRMFMYLANPIGIGYFPMPCMYQLPWL